MPAPIYPTTAAAPLLFLGLQKIARTPRPRLAVGYDIVPRYGAPGAGAACGWSAAPPPLGCCWVAGPLRNKGLRPLGQALLLDRLLAGGTVGEALPLAVEGDPRPLANRLLDAAAGPQLGIFLDVWA